MAFHNSKYLKGYEWSSWRPFNLIKIPPAQQAQRKSDYVITIDETNSSSPLDWFNAIISVKFYLRRNKAGAPANNARVAVINGSWMLINKLNVQYKGNTIISQPNIDYAVTVKYLLQQDCGFAESIGSNQFNFNDTADSTVITNNKGFAERQKLTNEDNVGQVDIPLKSYSFFDWLETELLPNGWMSFDVTFESNNNLIHRDNTAGEAAAIVGQVVIREIMLWVPRLIFNIEGEVLYLNQYLISKAWSYLKEDVVISAARNDSPGYFRILETIRRPCHLFVWALLDARMNNQLTSPVMWNIFNLTAATGGPHFTNLQLLVGNTRYLPLIPYENNDIPRVYHDVMNYMWGYNLNIKNFQLNVDNFTNLYGLY